MPKNITSVEWQALDIPPGLAFDQATGTFTGTPGEAGDFTVPVTVTTNYGTDTKDVLIKAVKTGEWGNIQVSGDFFPWDCVDTGKEIILFGRAYFNGGLYTSYNPLTRKISDVLQLIDGSKYEGITDAAYMFKDCVIDPESKKWLAFFGNHYLRTPEGVKDLGEDIDIYSMACCWSKELQKFCVISRNLTGEHKSYIFDIDGNLLDMSTSISEIQNFTISENNFGDNICWSASDNKFYAASTKQGVAVIISSTDGLNWEIETLNGTNLLGGMI
ncbi:MAG: putative Ig domain-containing protein, partial [Synergistaceae bacterium]|nr:putative Ig domain-containing protein [Synergistaceae bacterium]